MGLAVGIMMVLKRCLFSRMSDDFFVVHLSSHDCVLVCLNILKSIPDWVGNRFITRSALENGPFPYGGSGTETDFLGD